MRKRFRSSYCLGLFFSVVDKPAEFCGQLVQGDRVWHGVGADRKGWFDDGGCCPPLACGLGLACARHVLAVVETLRVAEAVLER